MTIREALQRVDSLKYNTCTDAEKITWLSKLDWMITNQIINTHERCHEFTFFGYTDVEDLDTTLIVPPPYDELYIYWLAAQIDFANGEIDKYNASITLYNTNYSAFAAEYNKRHMPLAQVPRFQF